MYNTYRVTEVTVRPTILHEKWYFSKNHFVTFYLKFVVNLHDLLPGGRIELVSCNRVFWSRSEFKIKKKFAPQL